MLLVLLIFQFSLLNFVQQLFFGKKIAFANALAVGNMAAAFVCAAILCYQIWANNRGISATWEWLSFAQPFLAEKKISLSLDLYIDKLSALMMLLVTGIATLVHIFSLAYMKKQAYLHRYWAYLGLFCAAMLGILVAGNLIFMFICWELVGVSSYFLIGFWFTQEAPAKASEKAFLVNRIGDIGFLAGILLLYTTFGTTNFHELNTLFAHATHTSDVWQFSPLLTVHCSLLTAIGLLLFCGCIAKSAQFPLQTWLPDAMEGPTPVSSLIHAATMVASGVYLLAKIYAFLTPNALTIIAIIGVFTAFSAAISAISQTDIKRVLAYSTISQLGYMVMAMGVNGYEYSLFHLLTHAFFKCGLFLVAAIIIHEIAHQTADLGKKNPAFAQFPTQDLRYMGGLRLYMPNTFYAYMGCMLALVGVPLFSGFLSKEGILIQTLQWAENQANNYGYFVPILAFLTVGITAFYMTRHALLIFGGENRLLQLAGSSEQVAKEKGYDAGSVINAGSVVFHDAKPLMLIPVGILALFSVFIWFSFSPFSAENSWFMLNILPPKNVFISQENHAPISHITISIISLFLVGIGSFAAYFLGKKAPQNLFFPKLFAFQQKLSSIYALFSIFNSQFSIHLASFDKKIIDGFVNLLANIVVSPNRHSLSLAQFAAQFDHHIIDEIVNNIGKGTKKLGENARNTQTGSLQSYILFSLIGILLLGGSAWCMLNSKPVMTHTNMQIVSEKPMYDVLKGVFAGDKMVSVFAETGYFSPILLNESEILATDSSEFARLNEVLGDSFSFVKNDFPFFQKQFKARPDSFLIVADSFLAKNIITLQKLAISLGDSTQNDSAIWAVFHEEKGRELRFFEISLPLFSENLQQCLLSVKMRCGTNCGKGHKVLLRKENEAWKVVKVFQGWAS